MSNEQIASAAKFYLESLGFRVTSHQVEQLRMVYTDDAILQMATRVGWRS